MSAYDDTVKAAKPDLYMKLDEIQMRMRSRAELFESIALFSDSLDKEQAMVRLATLEVLLDIRDLLNERPVAY